MIARLDAVRRLADGWGLLTDRSDVRWASGFGGSSGWLLVGPDQAHLVTDARYSERARLEIGSRPIDVVTIDASNDRYRTVGRLAGDRSIAVRSSAVTMDDLARFESLGTRLRAVDFSGLRRIKDPLEVETIRRAASIADRALTDVVALIDVGVTEVDVRDELDHRMRRYGADGPSYDTIVAAGPRHSAVPHHQPTRYAFAAGDPIVIDVGALVDGYHSDMTRTFVVGEPSDHFRRWYSAVAEAQKAGLDAVRPGVECRVVHEEARRRFGDEAPWFVHGTGHGVGLDIHEEPFLNGSSAATLCEGEVVTVEPGLYRVGFGGVRIEDLVVVRSEGADILTSSPKDLLCLPSRPTT